MTRPGRIQIYISLTPKLIVFYHVLPPSHLVCLPFSVGYIGKMPCVLYNFYQVCKVLSHPFLHLCLTLALGGWQIFSLPRLAFSTISVFLLSTHPEVIIVYIFIKRKLRPGGLSDFNLAWNLFPDTWT